MQLCACICVITGGMHPTHKGNHSRGVVGSVRVPLETVADAHRPTTHLPRIFNSVSPFISLRDGANWVAPAAPILLSGSCTQNKQGV